jgi:lysophospholipase L1-like esterase
MIGCARLRAPERIAFRWNRNSLQLPFGDRFFGGELAAASPEDALNATGASLSAHLPVLAVLLLVAIGAPARAQAPASASPAEFCLAANRNLSLGVRLPRTAARLRSGAPLRVVAVGSSSTTGLWVFNSEKTYPGVMRRELELLRPNSPIEIINSGRVGATIPDNLAHFDADVLAHQPDLVVWQLGTNDVAWGGRAEGLKDQLVDGIRLLKEAGIDVVLMDLQYAPMVLASSHHAAMQAIIAEAAREEQVGLFSRFALMRRSVEAGLPPGALVSWDGLHNSAPGYECIGRALARAVDAAAR